jgi:hypothetical protein
MAEVETGKIEFSNVDVDTFCKELIDTHDYEPSEVRVVRDTLGMFGRFLIGDSDYIVHMLGDPYHEHALRSPEVERSIELESLRGEL